MTRLIGRCGLILHVSRLNADSDKYLEREFDKLQNDALKTNILPPDLTLDEMSLEIFNLIRSFSFVGEIGEDAEDYRYIAL